MNYDDLPLSKLPGGKTILFTMEVRDLIDALLWEDEEHEPWAETNLELRYVADNAKDGVSPAIRGWELILESAQADYENTKLEDRGELCREIIATLSGEDPGEWHEKMAKLIFEPRFRAGSGYQDPEAVVKNVEDHMKELIQNLRRNGW
jgi:hypothetical protein